MGTQIRSYTLAIGMAASVMAITACTPPPKETASGTKETPCLTASDCTSDALHVASPDWRDQIIYFLMIDRFNDGNPGNNDQGMGEYNPTKESHYSGGDIPGITEKLDYIQELGATSVWLTPPVANLWWSNESSYGGYHGYWARDFSKVDEHYGTLQDYQTLSKSLHQRGMYLIQDIVVNHTAPYFGYRANANKEGNEQGKEYDPDDTAANFELFETGKFAAPEQSPFDKINRLDPEHEKAGIYHWTPSILDFDDKHQVTNYQLANLADINTENPEVITAFKEIYRDWIEKAGVDAYRVDTVKYVDHAFWNRFFHDDDGIYAHAKKLGKEDFLAFGEVYDVSKPFQDSGEKSLKSFYGSKDKPEFNSVIGFPLYNEIDRVFAEGKPPSYLAYRLEQHMQFPNPYIVPNFVDNHDVKRFLSSGSLPDFKQALSLIFTIPGIPVIYQGSEQAMRESRRAMFKGGYLAEQDHFDTQSEMFRFIQKLAEVRKANKVLSRGTLKVLHATDTSSGILAFRRQYQGDNVLVLMNTASHSTLVNHLASGFTSGMTPEILFKEGNVQVPLVSSGGTLNMVLPAKSIVVLKNSQQQENGDATEELSSRNDDITIVLDDNIDGEVFDRDIQISGSVTEPNVELLLILNGNLDRARKLQANSQGRFDFTLPVRNWGKNDYSLEVYAPELGVTSNRQIFTTLVTRPEVETSKQDPVNDDKGLNGLYQQPQHANSQRQMDILAVDAKAAGANLELVLTMQQISDVWGPSNGFDNVAFTIFFDFSTVTGAKELPEIGGVMPNGLDWELGNVVYGWGNYLFGTNARNPSRQGERAGIAPKVSVDKENNQIRLLYHGEELGIPTWRGTNVYVTTWDISGEGTYRELGDKADAWQFGDAGTLKVKIMDDLLLSLE